MQTKLTLSVTPSVVSRAKRYAKQQGISVSQMVEVYLSSVTQSVDPGQDHPPVLRSLLGSLKKADPKDYRTHLVKKYL
ncbi:MAG: DUF6364 family protein [Bryobacteraceae bacterium]|jgi:hypothetical protein